VALLSGGRLVALGAPGDVITTERLGAIYGVTVEIAQIDRPGGGRTRVCVPSLARPVAY
jgi:ABC-type cobalamin/Fe3+-siderophores transport system ATPase subunit